MSKATQNEHRAWNRSHVSSLPSSRGGGFAFFFFQERDLPSCRLPSSLALAIANSPGFSSVQEWTGHNFQAIQRLSAGTQGERLPIQTMQGKRYVKSLLHPLPSHSFSLHRVDRIFLLAVAWLLLRSPHRILRPPRGEVLFHREVQHFINWLNFPWV